MVYERENRLASGMLFLSMFGNLKTFGQFLRTIYSFSYLYRPFPELTRPESQNQLSYAGYSRHL